MSKINFTKEHKEKLNALALDALFNGTEFKGKMVANHTIHDLLHTVTLNTLTQLHGAYKKEASEIENMDQWSLTEHQQRKLKGVEAKTELINLLIGYKRHQAESEAAREKLKGLKAQLDELNESTKTPTERKTELEAQIAAVQAEVA